MTLAQQAPVIEVQHLKKYFYFGRRQVLHAVDDVSFAINRGEIFGLVGESGCGKTTVGKSIIGLYPPTSGHIRFLGQPINGSRPKRKAVKGLTRKMQMIFQDPYSSLNPRMTVADIVAEGLDIHKLASGKERIDRVVQLLETVGLNREHANRYPHEFSGGQRQRIGIARALALEPEFIIADEPISALDVSVRAQIINLLLSLQEQRGLTYLFIAHDLSVVRHISDRVGVMYLGKLVELAASDDLFREPLHPYTRALLSAIPIPDPRAERERHRTMLQGDVPSPVNPPPGCRFQSRCSLVSEPCREADPQLVELAPHHWVACHAANQL